MGGRTHPGKNSHMSENVLLIKRQIMLRNLWCYTTSDGFWNSLHFSEKDINCKDNTETGPKKKERNLCSLLDLCSTLLVAVNTTDEISACALCQGDILSAEKERDIMRLTSAHYRSRRKKGSYV